MSETTDRHNALTRVRAKELQVQPSLSSLIGRVRELDAELEEGIHDRGLADDKINKLRFLAPELADAAERMQGLLGDIAAHHKGIEWAGDQWGDDCCLDCGHLREGEDERSLAAAYKHQAHPPLTHKPDCKWAELSRRLSEFSAAPSLPDTEK